MINSSYDKSPVIDAPCKPGTCTQGWDGCAGRLNQAVASRGARKTVLAIECYPGVHEREIVCELQKRLSPSLVIKTQEALRPPEEVDELVAPFLGGEDPVFGFLSGLQLPNFLESGRINRLRGKIASVEKGLILVVGCGARLIIDADILVYADLTRWEAQNRFRRNEISNLGVANHSLPAGLQYKRAFFVDWRVADRWKRRLMAKWDFVLDTNKPDNPKLAEGEAVRSALLHVTTRPFRLVPFFDPAPWGGQWMRQTCELNGEAPNYGWCFDCVPEENSLKLRFDNSILEIPAINLVFAHPRALLGDAVHARFGDEFPIRFDLLDTMGGGNLSFQVHPLTEYIQHHFGMHYTQDESYYLLDAGHDASVYLGLREGINAVAMVKDLESAQLGGNPFPAEKYVNKFPARKHDHFLIPAGTVHCSGANSMVLEISATPYIFTFKMWDWGRLGLNGKPRPIHLKHGVANIDWTRTSIWVKENLVNRIDPLMEGEGWREERTGLHEREFIETRRHWFTNTVPHNTHQGVNVLNLVEGEEILVESPEGLFDPLEIHYAETFIVPAAVGEYLIRPLGARHSRPFATIKASVRTQNSNAVSLSTFRSSSEIDFTVQSLKSKIA